MSWLEIAGVVTSFVAIWLTAKRQMLCWPINLVACALYFKLFLDVRLYSDMVLQALSAISIAYGWIVWARGKADDGTVIVQPLLRGPAAIALVAGAVGAVAIGWFTSHYTNAALPWIDATLTSFSLVAGYWPDADRGAIRGNDRAGRAGLQTLDSTAQHGLMHATCLVRQRIDAILMLSRRND